MYVLPLSAPSSPCICAYKVIDAPRERFSLVPSLGVLKGASGYETNWHYTVYVSINDSLVIKVTHFLYTA